MTDQELLGVRVGASMEELKTAWRRLALELHPDHGGDPEAFRHALEAYRRLADAAGEPVGCETCGGRGRVVVSRGFSAVQLWCSSCGGTGIRS